MNASIAKTRFTKLKNKMGVKTDKPGDLMSARSKMDGMPTKKSAPKTFKGKSMKLGGGGRFAKLTSKLEAKGKSPEAAKAIAASVGRAKYGAKKMSAMAAKGKK